MQGADNPRALPVGGPHVLPHPAGLASSGPASPLLCPLPELPPAPSAGLSPGHSVSSSLTDARNCSGVSLGLPTRELDVGACLRPPHPCYCPTCSGQGPRRAGGKHPGSPPQGSLSSPSLPGQQPLPRNRRAGSFPVTCAGSGLAGCFLLPLPKPQAPPHPAEGICLISRDV